MSLDTSSGSTNQFPPVHLVTDSSAHFPPASGALLPGHVVVLPNQITINGTTYREGVDLDPDQAIHLISHQPTAPHVVPPSVSAYHEAFDRLARTGGSIISIHASKEISESWSNAKIAAQDFLGHTHIEVIDSATISTGQALLVLLAARCVDAGMSFDDVVRLTRSAVDRIYAVYYVETVDYLIQNRIMTPSHGILGTMMGIKPFVTIENGQMHLMEKVRTRIQAIERLVEFASEFIEIEDAVILQHKPHHSEQTRMLQDRLAIDFPTRTFPAAMYGASLAALIGADATGLVILEREETAEDNPS